MRQLVLLITIKDGKQSQLFILGRNIMHCVAKNTWLSRTLNAGMLDIRVESA
jgi:hypothetical protein